MFVSRAIITAIVRSAARVTIGSGCPMLYKQSTLSTTTAYTKKNPFETVMYLELLKGETTTSTELGVVLDGGATDGRADQAIDGARGDTGGLLDTRDTSGLLATRLVQPGLNAGLPVLAEVLFSTKKKMVDID